MIILCAKARNESLYLVDWLAWHAQYDFEKIIIATHDNDDSSLDLLNECKEYFPIEVLDVSGEPLNGRDLGDRSHDAIWSRLSENDILINIDIDEYVVFDQPVSQFKQKIENFFLSNPDSSLWMKYITVGGCFSHDLSVPAIEDFTRIRPGRKGLESWGKSIVIKGVTPQKLSSHVLLNETGTHPPLLDFNGLDSRHTTWSSSGLQLLHAIVRSPSHYRLRRMRGEAKGRGKKRLNQHNRRVAFKYDYLYFITNQFSPVKARSDIILGEQLRNFRRSRSWMLENQKIKTIFGDEVRKSEIIIHEVKENNFFDVAISINLCFLNKTQIKNFFDENKNFYKKERDLDFILFFLNFLKTQKYHKDWMIFYIWAWRNINHIDISENKLRPLEFLRAILCFLR